MLFCLTFRAKFSGTCLVNIFRFSLVFLKLGSMFTRFSQVLVSFKQVMQDKNVRISYRQEGGAKQHPPIHLSRSFLALQGYSRTAVFQEKTGRLIRNFAGKYFGKFGGNVARFQTSMAHIHFRPFTGECFTDFLFIHIFCFYKRRLISSIHTFTNHGRLLHSLAPFT